MNEKNRTAVPGPYSLPREGAIIEGAIINVSEASRGDASTNDYANDLHMQRLSAPVLLPLSDDLMMVNVEQRLQRWLGDGAADRFFSAPPTRRSPMPAANLEPPRLARSVRMISYKLMAIFGIPMQTFRRRSTSSSY